MSTRRILIGTFSSLLALATSLSALAQTTLYWDINGPTPGAGQDQDGFTDGLWGTDAFWSTDPTGSSATGPWTPGSHAVFSAGNDAVDSYIEIVPTPQVAASVTIEEGSVWIAGTGVVNRGDGDVIVKEGATLRISSIARLNNDGRVVLQGGTLQQSNNGFAGSFLGNETMLVIDGTGIIDRTVDDGATEPVERQISIYTPVNGNTIQGVGGTPENGGAGTLIKRGPAEFRYQGAGLPLTSYAKLVVEEGLFRLGFSGGVEDERGFGAVPLEVLPDAITLNGGSISTSFNPGPSELHPNRGITIGPNGGTFGAGHMRVPGPLSGSGTMTIAATSSTIRFTNPNNVNTFSGNVVVTSGVLDLDESLTTPNFSGAGGSVQIAAGKQLTVGSDNADATYSGTLNGPGDFVKVGSGVQTLSGAENMSNANMLVHEGTLRLTAPVLTTAVDISILSGALMNLDFTGTNVIGSLTLDGVGGATGTWGAVGSGATHVSEFFTGTGLLQVTLGPPEILVGDYNQDGVVDARDYVVWRNNLGEATLPNRDPANMGMIGADDYLAWKDNFGATAPGALSLGAAASVPEPGTIVLLSLAGLGAIGGCRRQAAAKRN
jgi:hypothetical protein